MANNQMKQKLLRLFCFLITVILLTSSESHTQQLISDKSIEVNMRKIGHEVLNCIGDKSSRVLAIEKINHQYKIPFESELSFDPDDIVTTIDRVIKETQLSNHYFVDVEQCGTKLLMHSYEMSHKKSPNQIACTGRVLPLDCYSLIITLVGENHSVKANTSDQTLNTALPILLILFLFSLIGFAAYLFTRHKKHSLQKSHPVPIENLISIGVFQFDQKNKLLISESQTVDLSDKETKLLSVLHESVNTTVTRDTLLQKVWKNEGDYIGRTLDVFISKLRKKLDNDKGVNIMTERGIGYRLEISIPAI